MSILFLEPYYIEDKLVTGLAQLDELAPGLFRASFYEERRSIEGGAKERYVVSKFLLTADSLKALARALDAAGKECPAPTHGMPAAASVN